MEGGYIYHAAGPCVSADAVRGTVINKLKLKSFVNKRRPITGGKDESEGGHEAIETYR